MIEPMSSPGSCGLPLGCWFCPMTVSIKRPMSMMVPLELRNRRQRRRPVWVPPPAITKAACRTRPKASQERTENGANLPQNARIGSAMPATGLRKCLPLLPALSLIALIVAGAASPSSPHGMPDAAAEAQMPADSAVLDEAWRVIRDNFYRRDLSAVGWDQVR